MMLDDLRSIGFEILCENHAEAILTADFPAAVEELEETLRSLSIPVEELIRGGGGAAKVTQRLRRKFEERGWNKQVFEVKKLINKIPRESQSHEVDHVREFGPIASAKRIALEIEWNNKDPFFDRDLENFKRLHADGAVSVGIIVTRGRSLHEGMRGLIAEFLTSNGIGGIGDLDRWNYDPTKRQRRMIEKEAEKHGFITGFSRAFVSDKYGEATTHWRKLEDRVRRGVGNPCPLVLIGIPRSVVRS